MLRRFRLLLFPADDHVRCRRQRRCIPSLPEFAARLEDRVLLSAAGGHARTVETATDPADTRAGKEVVNLFESTPLPLSPLPVAGPIPSTPTITANM